MNSDASLAHAQRQLEALQAVLDRQQYFAWDALREAVITVDEVPMLRPATGGRALRALLDLLAGSTPIAIERIDVEVLASGLYEAVMDRAGLTPDPRIFDPAFRTRASREFDLEPNETLWDAELIPPTVLEEVRGFNERDLEYVGPNLTHG